MKKILSIIVALAMVLSMAPAVFAATPASVIADNVSDTFDDTAAFNGTQYTFTPAADGTVTVSFTACDPGYFAMLFDNAEMMVVEEVYASTAGDVTFNVTAGKEYMVQVSSATYYNGNLQWTSAGSVTYSITADVAVEMSGGNAGGGDVGGGEPSDNVLVLGDNTFTVGAQDAVGHTGTYTAPSAGTLTISISGMYADTDMDGTPETMLGVGPGLYNGFMNYAFVVNGTQVYDLTTTVDVAAGDTVTVSLAGGNPMASAAEFYVNLGLEPAGGNTSGMTLVAGDNTFIVGAQDAVGQTGTYTAPSAGTLTISISGMYADTDMDGTPETMLGVGPGLYNGFMNYAFVVNGTQVYDLTTTVDVAAGDTVTVSLAGGNPMASAAEFYVNLTLSGSLPGGGSEPDGSMGNPYVIDFLPYYIPMFGEGTFDLYYTFTTTQAGTIVVTCPADAFLSLPNGEVSDKVTESGLSTYTIEVEAGYDLVLNPWYNDPSLTGDFVIEYAPEASNNPLVLGDNIITAESMDMVGQTMTYTATQAGGLTITAVSLNADTNGDGVPDSVISGQQMGMPLFNNYVLSINGEQIYDFSKTVNVVAGDTVTVSFACSSFMSSTAALTVNLSLGDPIPGGGSEPDGSMGNPYVLESLPFMLDLDPNNTFDVYYVYTAEQTGTIEMTCPAGAYITTNVSYDCDEGDPIKTYTINVVAGEEISLNPWYTTPGITGVFTFEYVAGAPAGEVVASGEEVLVTDEGNQITYTPTADGTMTIVISGNPGYQVDVTDSQGEPVGLRTQSVTERELTYDLVAGETYTITICGFSYDTWATTNATVSYEIVYGEPEVQIEPWIDGGAVVLGENAVVLAPNAEYTLFTFTPEETGVYQITASGAAMELWLSSTYTKIEDAQDGVLNVTIEAVGQSAMVALAGFEAADITIVKTGETGGYQEIVYVDYVNVHTPVAQTIPSGEIVKLDVSAENPVYLCEDGYCRYGSVEGPLVIIDLETEEFSLSAAYSGYGATAMNGTFNDEHYNFLTAMKAYADAADANGYYPLTWDLAVFMVAYGEAQGWYTPGLSPFAAIDEAENLNADSAWMVLCSYVVGSEPKAPVENGWAEVDGEWYYYSDSEEVTNAWIADGVGWCYVGEDGAMLTNAWVMDSVTWCYVGEDGRCVTNRWVQDSKGWCYLGADGRMVTNAWVMDSVGWCYVGADGYCVTNKWVQDSKGWCYLGADGRMVTNAWVQDSKGWCYVGADGYCVTNAWIADSQGLCWLDANGNWTGARK